MITLPITSITEICLPNRPGIREIVFFEITPMVILPAQHYFASVTEPVIFAGDVNFWTISFTKFKCRLREAKIVTQRPGDYYDREIIMQIPKDRLEVMDMTHRLRNRRIGAITTDWNGHRRLLTNLRHDSAYDSGEDPSSRNLTQYRFRETSTYIAPQYISEFIYIHAEGCEEGLIGLTGLQLVNIDGNCLIKL